MFSEEDFISPIQKLTKEELREELKVFKPTNNLLAINNDDDDTGELQFRVEQPFKRSICCYYFKESSCVIS